MSSESSAVSPFERVIFLKRVPYWIYWPFIGVLYFGVWEIIARLFSVDRFYLSEISISIGTCLSFTLSIYLTRRFKTTARELEPLFWDSKKEFEDWLETKMDQIFTFKSQQAKVVFGIVILAIIITILRLGIHANTPIGKFFVFLWLIPFIIACSQSTNRLLAILLVLRELASRYIKADFFLLPHPAITSLNNFYSSVAVIVTIAYLGIALAFSQGPYGSYLEVQVWLILLAFYPLSMFFWSFWKIHGLMRKIKNSHLMLINKEVQQALQAALVGNRLEEVERLEKFMDIQIKLQNVRDWPIAIEAPLIFIATLATAIVPLIVTIIERSSP